jgi:hypothetical protein
MHYVNDFSLDLVVDQVVFEAFDGELADLGEFWVGEAAESADSGEFGDLLEGGFGGIDKSVACIEIVAADVGGDVNQVLDDDGAFD